ncbi:MAG: DUF1579 domain-containing protein [Phycisphaerales bacterium]
MRASVFIGGFLAGSATMLLAATTFLGQDTKPAMPDPPDLQDPANMDPAAMEQMMQDAMEKYGNPSEEHAMLAKLAGEWECDVKWWFAPGMPPESSPGTASFEMILDGRYLLQTFNGNWDGQEFTGNGLMGYDRMNKQYQSVWVDSFGTGMGFSTGQGDGHTIELKGVMPDMMLGKNIEVKEIQRMVDADTMVFEMYTPGPDGNMFKSMEITYTRK